MKTAHETYIEKRAALMANICRLITKTELHATQEEKDKGNWGYVGDIEYMNQMVLQALEEAK